MSAFVAVTLTFSGAALSVTTSVNSFKGAGWELLREGQITFWVDRTNDYTWHYASSAAMVKTLEMLEFELASGAKVGIVLHLPDHEYYDVYLTFTDPLSITAIVSADRKVIDIGNEQELTDISWYIEHLVRPICANQAATQLYSFEWSELP